jgi:hypothetical protein
MAFAIAVKTVYGILEHGHYELIALYLPPLIFFSKSCLDFIGFKQKVCIFFRKLVYVFPVDIKQGLLSFTSLFELFKGM